MTAERKCPSLQAEPKSMHHVETCNMADMPYPELADRLLILKREVVYKASLAEQKSIRESIRDAKIEKWWFVAKIILVQGKSHRRKPSDFRFQITNVRNVLGFHE